MLAGLYRNIFDNPILTRELRRRMRGRALVYSIIGYIAIMAATSILILLAGVPPTAGGTAESTQQIVASMADTGQRLFQSISFIQALLVLLIAPTITAGLTTNEKERKTFDFLRVTTISPSMYIVGSFLSTVFYVALALLCALPLISLAFLYGGIGRAEVATMAVRLLCLSMALSAFGLYVSSIRERTRTAQGIVVFLLFAACFGGMLAYGQIQRTLAMAGGGGGGVLLFGGFPVPWILLEAGAMLVIAALFLLVATRKLFEPEEARAFGHVQFLVIFLALAWLPILSVRGASIGDKGTLGFLVTGSLLLAVAAGCFAVGRMEVGDEMWKLKRLAKPLRRIDQTPWFLVGLGVLWWFCVSAFTEAPAQLVETPVAMVWSTAWIALAGYAFFCAVGRWATAVSVGRKGAGRIAMGTMAALWLGGPFVGAILGAASAPGGALALAGEFLSRLSPFFVMFEGLAPAAADYYSAEGAALMELPVAGPVIALAMAAAIVLAIGEYKRLRRWRGFDYHFDMPGA